MSAGRKNLVAPRAELTSAYIPDKTKPVSMRTRFASRSATLIEGITCDVFCISRGLELLPLFLALTAAAFRRFRNVCETLSRAVAFAEASTKHR